MNNQEEKDEFSKGRLSVYKELYPQMYNEVWSDGYESGCSNANDKIIDDFADLLINTFFPQIRQNYDVRVINEVIENETYKTIIAVLEQMKENSTIPKNE